MQETIELISVALGFGEDLIFSFGTIKGFPGNEIYSVQNFDSPYDIKKQDFYFKISSIDFFENVLIKGDRFNYASFGKNYIFEIIDWKNNLSGWVTLQVSLEGIETNV